MLHSSDSEYKTGNEALYPTVNSWFSNVTKRYVDSKCGRYLNYLIGEPAYKFQEIALKNNYKNSEIHSWIASYLCDCNVSGITYNHYGMPKENIVQIGTYLIGPQDTVPIFSRLGYPVAMFKPDPCMWGIKINKIKNHIIPHGWGQKIDDLVSVEVSNNKLVIRQHSSSTQFAISESSKLPDNLVQVRDFGKEFVCNPNWNNSISGVICDVFYPEYLYCRFGEYKYAE